MANTDLTTQHFPADTSEALDAANPPVAFELSKGGKVSVQCDVPYYTWWSDEEDTSVPTKAMAWDSADVFSVSLRGERQKTYLMVQTQGTTGTAKALQE